MITEFQQNVATFSITDYSYIPEFVITNVRLFLVKFYQRLLFTRLIANNVCLLNPRNRLLAKRVARSDYALRRQVFTQHRSLCQRLFAI